VAGEPGQSFIDGGDFVEAVGRDGEVVVHLDAMEAAGSAASPVLAGVVDENLAHDVGGEADELGAAAPVDVLAGLTEVGFVDERGGLEGVVGALTTRVGLSEAMELGVDKGKQAVGGSGFAGVHRIEELGDLARG
jgi:hypothetical protein